MSQVAPSAQVQDARREGVWHLRAAAHLRNWDLPPRYLWLLPVTIGVLRMLPFLWTLCCPAPPGQMVLQASYMPPDVMSYHAFVRQAGESGSVLLENPYTLVAQDGRYVLLLHSTLGFASRLTGFSPAWVWELSRFPLACVFLLTLWWFLKPILPDRVDRSWACVLVAFSGGIEGLIKLVVNFLPGFFAESFSQATWHLYGWNTFEVMANPMWIAGTTLLLVVLKPLLQPGGMRGLRDQLQVGIGFLFLFYIHPYSGLMVLSIAGSLVVTDVIFRGTLDLKKHTPMMRALFVPFTTIALISTWQSQDAVYRETAGHVFGTLQLAVFWYPFTLGAVGLLALRGARRWVATSHAYRFGMLAWIAAVIFMHTSPVLNGYHFAMYLHLPLCILAATELRQFLRCTMTTGDGQQPWRRRSVAGAMLCLTFVSSVLVSLEAIADIRRNNLRPAEYAQIVEHMECLPPGRVMADHELGAILPTYTPHRVFVGHWFLSPDYVARRDQYAEAVAPGVDGSAIVALIDEEQVDYALVPRHCADDVAARLVGRYSARVTFETQTLFVLRRTAHGT